MLEDPHPILAPYVRAPQVSVNSSALYIYPQLTQFHQVLLIMEKKPNLHHKYALQCMQKRYFSTKCACMCSARVCALVLSCAIVHGYRYGYRHVGATAQWVPPSCL